LKKNSTILILLILVIWLGKSLIRIENERMALFQAAAYGTCTLDHSDPIEFFRCLDTTETRTSNILHLFYALKIL